MELEAANALTLETASSETSVSQHDTLADRRRLIPALAPGPYVIEPEEIDRFYVRIQEDGTLFFKGSRERIEAFLQACEEVGLHLQVSHIAYCG